MSVICDLELLDGSARQMVSGKAGATPMEAPAVLERLGLNVAEWTGLVRDVGKLFALAAGLPATLANRRVPRTNRRFPTRRGFHEPFESQAA